MRQKIKQLISLKRSEGLLFKGLSSRKREEVLGEQGKGEIFLIFLLLSAAAVYFIALPIVGFYYSFIELEGLCEFQAKRAVAENRTDEKVRSIISREIRRQGINALPEEDLTIERDGDSMRIILEWEEILAIDLGDLFYQELYVFEFIIDEEHKFERR